MEKKQSAKYSNKESIIAAVNGYKDDIRWRRIWLIADSVLYAHLVDYQLIYIRLALEDHGIIVKYHIQLT